MSTIRNSAMILAAQVSLLFSGAIINFVLGRLLGPTLYGQFGVVYATATVMNLLITPGIMQSVSKYCAVQKNDGKAIIGKILGLQLFIGLAVSAVYFFAAFWIALLLKDTSILNLLRWLTPLLLIYSLTAVYGGFIQGTGQFGKQAVHFVIYSLTRVIATISMAFFFSITGAIIALPLAGFVSLAYFALFSGLKPKISLNAEVSIYRQAFPITIFVGLIAFTMNLDLYFISIFFPGENTGYYTAAATIARIPYFVLTALGLILLPKTAEKLSSSTSAKSYIQSSFRYVIMFLFPLAAIISAKAEYLAILLYRSEYISAGPALAILSISSAVMTLFYLLGIILNASGKAHLSALASFFFAILSAAMLYALVPTGGLKAAASAVTISACVSFILLYYLASKIHHPFNFLSTFRILCASGIIYFIGLWMPLPNKFVLPIAYCILGVIYIGLLFAIKEANMKDIKRLLELIPKKLI